MSASFRGLISLRASAGWLLVLLLLGGGIWWVRHGKQPQAPALQQAAVTRGSVTETISSTGTLSALQEVTVGSQVSGIVTKVLVDFNSHVKAGQLLAVVDPQTLQASVDSARANVALRQVAYDEAVRQAEEGKRLYAQKYIADTDLRALEVAVRSTKAQLDAATVDFNKQNVQLKYAEIRAPIDGVVMSRSVDPGNTVQASMQAPTLFVIASDLRKLRILANVDETQIPRIKDGMQARFTVSGIENRTFTAVVDQVRLKPTTVNNVVTYTVVLLADNPDEALYPGMTATIDFVLSRVDDQLLVPASALRVRVPDELRVPSDKQGARQGNQQGEQHGISGDASTAKLDRNGAANNAATNEPHKRPSMVWRVTAEGLVARVPVKVLGSDLTNTAIAPLQPEAIKEGDMIVTKIESAGDTSRSSSSRGPNMMMGPGFEVAK